jgi:hypothetical protein
MNNKEKQYHDILRKIDRIDEQIQLLNARKTILNNQKSNLELSMQRDAERADNSDSSQES